MCEVVEVVTAFLAQRKRAFLSAGFREAGSPSQSALPTALPKGEPRKNLPPTQGEVASQSDDGEVFPP